MKSLIDLVKTDSIHLGVREMLQSPPSILIGVDAATSSVLQTLGIETVFDLATSRLFANAALIAEARTNAASLFAQHGAVAAGVVDPEALGERVEDLHARSIALLEGISDADATAFASAAGVEVIRDLALWPPYLAARSLVHAEYVPSMADGADPEAPPDLLPKSGDYPTERVFYSTLVFDRVLSGDGANGAGNAGPGDLVSAGRIDLTPATDPNLGFDAPALGALLTFEQSWYAKGVTLGQLLHSVALAPGESTRIAVVDWSRRTRGARDESTTQTESLTNSMQHSRALSEVTDAVAVEAQSGFSTTETTSKTKQAGAGGGFSLGPVTVGGSASGASTTTSATSFASSFGRRTIAADYSQKIVDRTQQHANSVRNRRASVVQEVSQSEHETVSTRVVTNYNHMHALSVQYYEVVQVYRMAVRMDRAERCLFIPLQLVDFSKPVFVEKYRNVLIEAAIDMNARRLLTTDYGVVEIIPGRPVTPIVTMPQPISPGVLTGTVVAASLAEPVSGSALAEANAASPAITLPTLVMGPTATSLSSEILSGWNVEQLDKLSWLFSRPVYRPKRLSASVPDDTLVIGFRIESAQLEPITVERAGGAAPLTIEGKRTVTFDPPVPITELVSIRVANKANEEIETDLVLTLIYMGTTFPLNVPVVAAAKAKRAQLVQFSGTRASNELVEHLQANRLHYSQAIYRSLDAAALALLLSPYQFEGHPLIEQIDPLPVTITGNYLVFRSPSEIRQPASDNGEPALTAWGQWLSDHGLQDHTVADDIVPLPSGGVFAEAVLGRFNSAEKLDITRFWNWQDSPIPIQAPDIAAIQLGSRAQPENLTPGELASPLINVVTPAPFPDPTGLSAVLAAIGKGDMFRDMSGLASTIGLAQAALQASGAGATAAGAQAGANLATIAQLEAEKFKATMALVGAAMGVPVSPGGASSISGQGAKINHGKSLDSREVGPPAGGKGTNSVGSDAGSSGGGSGSGPSGGGNGASGGGSTPAPAAPNPGGSYEAAGFTEALWGPTGESLGGFATSLVEAAYMPGPGTATLNGSAASLQCPVGERVLQSSAEFVPEVAAIMRHRGWTTGAEYQEFWFSHPANQLIGDHKLGLGTTGSIDIKEIDLDWVLTFQRAQELYARIASPDVYANPAARAVIKKMLDARFAASGPATVTLGDVAKKGRALEDEYCNHLGLGNTAAYSSGLDALTAALGRFTLYVIPTGTATRDAQGTHVEIRDVGVYLRDSFDFNGDQDLGWWQKPDYVQATTGPHRRYFPACSNDLIPMTNAAYRQYRQQTDLGRDFLIYSNVKVETRPPIQFDY